MGEEPALVTLPDKGHELRLRRETETEKKSEDNTWDEQNIYRYMYRSRHLPRARSFIECGTRLRGGGGGPASSAPQQLPLQRYDCTAVVSSIAVTVTEKKD